MFSFWPYAFFWFEDVGPVDPSHAACVVLCDVPEYSVAMRPFIPDLRTCSGKFIFVDPNMGSPPLKFHEAPRYHEAADIPIQQYVLEKEDGFLGKLKYPAYWDEVPLKEYTGIKEVADLPLLGAALEPELKGSIGEGPNHSNHSNHSNPFKIQEIRILNSKISENFNIFFSGKIF